MSANVKRVSLQERTLPVGNIVGINGYKVNKAMLRKSIEDEGYTISETPHFFVIIRSMVPSVIVIHWFAPEELNSRLGDYILQELKPLGAITDVEDFDALFGAIVGSLYPHEANQAWHLYTKNTLRQLQHLTYSTSPLNPVSTLETFALLYRRVFELQVGKTFLDAGCSSGFLPLLMAEQNPLHSNITGIDIRPDPFGIARTLAEEQKLNNVRFIQANLLDNTFCNLGYFDTVTLLHVLEHFSEQDMYIVLTNLLTVTTQRLIIAVPYERTPETAYGHEQIFSRTKLEAVGRWCIEQWKGKGTMKYEDCADGLLVVERIRE